MFLRARGPERKPRLLQPTASQSGLCGIAGSGTCRRPLLLAHSPFMSTRSALTQFIGPISLATLIISLASRTTGAQAQVTPSPDLVAWFQRTEQALMNAIAPGDKAPWERVMDPGCVATTEEGQLLTRVQFLADLRPMPAGLSGGITVKELTVQEVPGLAVVRFLADEWQTVFGQRLTTAYRITDVFRRFGDDWKMVASHASVVTRDPPEQEVSTAGWPGLVGHYRLSPGSWELTVELRDGALYGGRGNRDTLRRLIPLAPNVFVRSGGLGEWIFVTDERGRATRIVQFRKFEPLVWSRVDASESDPARPR